MLALLCKCPKFDLPTDIRLELFDRFVIPVMLYACEIWGLEKADILKRSHVKFLNYTLKVKTSKCTNMIYEMLGRYPLCTSIKKRINGDWGILRTGKETKLS